MYCTFEQALSYEKSAIQNWYIMIMIIGLSLITNRCDTWRYDIVIQNQEEDSLMQTTFYVGNYFNKKDDACKHQHVNAVYSCYSITTAQSSNKSRSNSSCRYIPD